MAAINSAVPSDVFRKSEARSWDMIGEPFDRVFAQDNADLANEYHARLNAYRRSLENASTMELLLVYHAEPLDVAADLARRPAEEDRPNPGVGWRHDPFSGPPIHARSL